MIIRSILCGGALVVASAAAAPAEVINFSGAYSNGQTGIPAAYQPLVSGYASGDGFAGPGTGKSGAAADGGPLGINITWAANTSNHDANNGVADHTGDTANAVAYDNGAPTMTLTFSAPVTVPSFFFAYYSNGPVTPQFAGYTNPGDTTPAVAFSQDYPGGMYNWQQATGFGSTPVRQVVVTGVAPYLQLDDVTVNAVPEPATMALVGLGAFMLLRRRERAISVR